jgi:hypothetical protein
VAELRQIPLIVNDEAVPRVEHRAAVFVRQSVFLDDEELRDYPF